MAYFAIHNNVIGDQRSKTNSIIRGAVGRGTGAVQVLKLVLKIFIHTAEYYTLHTTIPLDRVVLTIEICSVL